MHPTLYNDGPQKSTGLEGTVSKKIVEGLNLFNSISFLFVGLDKQCRPRSDAAKYGGPLFTYIMFYKNLIKNEKNNIKLPLKRK